MLPLECVVRGYLAGSGWKDYSRSGEVCGHALPEGLRESDKLPAPIFTPAHASHLVAGHKAAPDLCRHCGDDRDDFHHSVSHVV